MRRNSILVIFLCFVAFNIGFYLKLGSGSEKLDDLIKVSDLVKSLYVDNKSDDDLMDSAMKSMVGSLDPHSHLFIGPEISRVVENFRDRVYGDGVGMSVRSFEDAIHVVEVYEGYPAYRAGIKPGDIVVGVNGIPVKGMSPERVVDLVRGKEGTTVSVDIKDNNSGNLRSVILERQKIKINSVVSRDIGGPNAYIKIRSFNPETTKEFFISLLDANGKEGLILDLRDNPGGDVEAVVDMTSYFIGADKLVISTKGNKLSKEYRTKRVPNIPIEFPKDVIILVNNQSASASEVMAGNLRHYKVATILGTRTYGKASVQVPLDVHRPDMRPDENTKLLLVLTVSRYYLPDGTDISSKGVTPDFEVSQADNFRAYDYLTEKDAQFQAALKRLNIN